MRFKLFVGGMQNLNRDYAIQMMVTDEEDIEQVPRFPKILSALGIPIIWFWGELYIEDIDPIPELPAALNKEYFTIEYDYSREEVLNLLGIKQ